MTPDKIRLLLVEDDDSDAFLVRKTLSHVKHSTYEVEHVKSYDEALAAIGRREHDAILLDYHLGAYSGLGLLQEAIKNSHMPTMIVISGQEDHDIDMMTMEAGASDYLLKGELSPSLLERTIRYAIERKRIEEMLRTLLLVDDLTGLFNRRAMNVFTMEETERSKRYSRPVGLILLDLDHFKEVNDRHGHQMGDDVLCIASRVIRNALRIVDRAIRYGGDEFLILLPETDAKGTYVVAERLRKSMESESERMSEISLPLSFTLGSGSIPEDSATIEELMKRVDEALYKAKRQGGNCTVVVSPMEKLNHE